MPIDSVLVDEVVVRIASELIDLKAMLAEIEDGVDMLVAWIGLASGRVWSPTEAVDIPGDIIIIQVTGGDCVWVKHEGNGVTAIKIDDLHRLYRVTDGQVQIDADGNVVLKQS